MADSISTQGIRLTTMELSYHRFIHSEFMTHRMFSRNAASSRAIPVEKMLKQVEENPAMPIHWGLNCPGMQAKEEISYIPLAVDDWKACAKGALMSAEWLMEHNLHKQIVNRVLEPFQFIKVIVTATEWDNFFKLRCHADAQPEMQELARCMKEAMDNSIPTELKVGQWHLPYVTEDYGDDEWYPVSTRQVIKCSVARCARVSYLNHDNSSPDIEKDIALYDRLLEAGHMSPFEHIATPMKVPNDWECIPSKGWSGRTGVTHIDMNGNAWSGNFRGWIQHRQLLQGN